MKTIFFRRTPDRTSNYKGDHLRDLQRDHKGDYRGDHAEQPEKARSYRFLSKTQPKKYLMCLIICKIAFRSFKLCESRRLKFCDFLNNAITNLVKLFIC